MLEARELVKIYKPKKGVPVVALDKVNLKLPDTGMVFLLGKSGSGKSTLLNTLGGLDDISSGEIIIKGVSSKSFKQQHFDSYRNTYVGFIFQEYNVLDEFTVGANIALAIELQGRRAADEEINEILKEVDLEGYGARRPNELSGGQKQRVAIARALVKKPEIIMADEPTGALDSATGRQVFETLKKLSNTRLVIVVSHDREFAESYADRIIELSDGKIISDVELAEEALSSPEQLSFSGNTIEIPSGYSLTEQDREQINAYIKDIEGGNAVLRINEKAVKERGFRDTDLSKIKQSGGEFKLIKSKLPLKNAFKIGASGLKYKKLRLAVTILLSCISFGLFGLSDTFGSYNHIKTCTNSLVDSNVEYLTISKSKKVVRDGDETWWRDYGYGISDNDLKKLSSGTTTKMHGVYAPINAGLSFEGQTNPEIKLTDSDYSIYEKSFSSGYAEINEGVLREMGFKLLAGRLPDGTKDEIAVSEYIFEVFRKADYFDGVTYFKDKKGEKFPKYVAINNYADLIGKTITLDGVKYTVTGIVDTNFDIDRYTSLTVKKDHLTKAEELLERVLLDEFSYSYSYSFTGVVMVGDGYIDKLIARRPPITKITEGYISFYGENYDVDSEYLARLSDVKREKIVWLNGEKTTLGEKEIIATTDVIGRYDETELVLKDYLKKYPFLSSYGAIYGEEEKETEGYTIVGYIDLDDEKNKPQIFSTVVCSDSLYNDYTDGNDDIYDLAVGSMPKDKADIKTAMEFCYDESGEERYPVKNSVTYQLDLVNDTLKEISVYFFWAGVCFALFAALMLSNFIAMSISYKKQEIGILRAIGSRSNDVFRIFFAESFVIAIINFILSAVGVFAATTFINYVIRVDYGILVTVLSFGIRQIALLLAVSLLVAFIASFIPVKRIASKKPIDAIRNK